MAKWTGVLSTTEPRNDIGILNVRQSNKNSEIAEFQIVANNKPYDLTGLTVFFCSSFDVNLVEKATTVINAKEGRIRYVFDEDSMQRVGRQKAYFSIKNAETMMDSTQEFEYRIQSSLLTRLIDGKSHIYRLEVLINMMEDFIATGQTNFDTWFDSVKELLYGVDPGGNILRELIGARTGLLGKVFPSLKDRLDTFESDTTAQLAHNENRPYTVKNVQSTSSTPKPIVVFTFDDGAKEDIEVMKPIFDEFGYKFTTFIIAGLIGQSYLGNPLMDVNELRLLYEDGHEIGSHTMTHIGMGSNPPETVDYEMRESKRILESLGFEVNNFAYPFGQQDNVAQRISLKYYRTSSLFMSGSIPNRIPINKSGLHRISLGSFFDPTTQDFPITDTFNDYYKRWVDDAIENKRLTIFALHPWELVNDEEQMTYLRQTLQYCQNNDVDVMTLNEALNYFDNQLDFKVYNEDSTVKSDITFDANGELSSGSMIFTTHVKTKLSQTALPSDYPKGFSRMEINDGNLWTLFGGNLSVYTDNSINYPDAVRQWVYRKWDTGIQYRSAKLDGTWTDFVNLIPTKQNKFALLGYKPVSTSFDIEPYTTVVYDVPNSVLDWQSVVVANSKIQLPKGVEYTVWNNAGQGCKLQITNTSPTVQWIPNTTEFNIKEV